MSIMIFNFFLLFDLLILDIDFQHGCILDVIEYQYTEPVSERSENKRNLALHIRQLEVLIQYQFPFPKCIKFSYCTLPSSGFVYSIRIFYICIFYTIKRSTHLVILLCFRSTRVSYIKYPVCVRNSSRTS